MYHNMDILEINSNFTLNTDINGPLLSAAIALIMVTAFVANLFVICITFCFTKSWKQPSTIFLTNLLLADFVLVTVMPFGVISTAYSEWIFGQSVEQKYQVCQFAAFMFWYSSLLITVTLTVISLDRFLSIVKPLFYRRHIYMKPQIAVTVVIIVWIVCARSILNTTPLYGFGRFQFIESHGFCLPETGMEQLSYSIFMPLIFVILLCCMIVTSIWTCCSTHGYFRRASERSSNQMEVENIYSSKKRQVIGIFGALLLMNAITFLPFFIAASISLFISPPPKIDAIAMVCACFSTAGSPLVQVLFRQDIKTSLNKLYLKIIAATCSIS